MKGWVIFLSAFALYFVSIFGGFVQDDLKVIAGDPGMGRVESLIKVWTRPYYYLDQEKSLYRPMTSFSFYLNSLITGKGAWGFRLGNVLLYSWVCWLVYGVMRKFLDGSWIATPACRQAGLDYEIRNDKWREKLAFWGALVFVVMPIHTEVVNNIVGRAEMLSLGFMLLAILENFKNRWDVSALFLFLAMLSKETAVVGVVILMYLIFIRGGGVSGWIPDQVGNDKSSNGTSASEKTAAMILVIMAMLGFGMMRLLVLGGGGMETRATMVENPLKFVSAEKRMINGIALIPFGVGKVLFPINLSYDYSYNQIKLVESWTDWRVVVGLVMIALSCIYLYRFRVKPGMTDGVEGDSSTPATAGRSLGMTMVGMVMFWGPILITGNILFPIGTIFGERLWFLPSLGVVMIAMLIGSKTAKNRTPALLFRPAEKRDPLRLSCTWSVRLFGYSSAPIFIAILFLLAGRTFVRNLDWLSQERLFLHDGGVATGSVMAQSNKAAIYLMKNDLENAKKFMEKADEIYPKYPELLNNWGLYYSWTGKKEEAKKKFEECLVQRPGYELCERNMEIFK